MKGRVAGCNTTRMSLKDSLLIFSADHRVNSKSSGSCHLFVGLDGGNELQSQDCVGVVIGIDEDVYATL